MNWFAKRGQSNAAKIATCLSIFTCSQVALADGPPGSAGASKPPEPKLPPKVEVKIPKLPVNALTPADKNFGGTSIYLVDKKAAEARRKRASQVLQKGKPSTAPKPPQPSKPKDAVIINSGEDAGSSKLAPQGYFQDNSNHYLPAVEINSCPQDPYLQSRKSNFSPIALQGSAAVTMYVIQVAPSRSDFYAFTRTGESISSDLIGKGSPLLVGTRGTVVSTNDKLVTLHAGCILVDTGAKSVRVANREMGVKVPPYSTALIEYAPGTTMRAILLAGSSGVGNGAETMSARAASKENELFSLSNGEGLVLDTQGTYKKKYDLNLLASTDLLLRECGGAMAANGRLRSHLSGISGLPLTGTNQGKPLRVMAADGSEFYVNEKGELVLAAGWICADAPAGSIFATDLGKVYCKRRAFVNIEQVPGYFRVGNCSEPNSVAVTFGKYRVPLAEGEEILFCDHTPTAMEIAAGDGLLRRKLQSSKLDAGGHAVLGDFSIYSLLYNANQLKPLRLAATGEDKRTLNKLISTLSKIQFSTGGRGEYSDAPTITGALPKLPTGPNSYEDLDFESKLISTRIETRQP